MTLTNPVLVPHAPPAPLRYTKPGRGPRSGSVRRGVGQYAPDIHDVILPEEYGGSGISWSGAATSYGTGVATAAASGQNVGQAAVLGGVATAGQIMSGLTAAAWAVPLIGAAVAGVTFWLSSIFRRNAQKKAATQIVDQIEPKLKENLDAYFSGPRTRESQAQALHNFDAAWEAMRQACANSQLRDAGRRCISDRDRGACVWKARCSRRIDGVCADYDLDPAGECWNWFVGYRDPIEKDPMPAMLAQGRSALPGVADSLASGGSSLLLLAGAGLILYSLLSAKGD